jgi:hypothetical protein
MTKQFGTEAMNSLDGTTLASYTIVVFLLRKLRAKGLLSADEVAAMIERAMLEFEAEGLDDATMKAGHRLLQQTRSLAIGEDLAEPGETPSHPMAREAA